MNSEIPVINKNNDNFEITDLDLFRYRGLAKEYFEIDVLQRPDYAKLIAASKIFYNFSLPAELNEIFIMHEYAPLYWSFQSPLILHIEDFMKKTLPQIGGQNFYKNVKEFYLKWLIINTEKEKKYFATSTINFIEIKSNKNNFLHLIYYSMILAYDETLFNPDKSIELLDKSLEVINSNGLSSDVKEGLIYLIYLYKGFIYLKINKVENAYCSFSDALAIRSDGINAKYFCSYSDFLLNKESIQVTFLTDITNYDLTRIEFAIENNDLNMLDYFINYATITNIFYYPEMARSYQFISDFFFNLQGPTEQDMASIKKKLNNFINLNMVEYHDERISGNIAFMESFLQKYSNSKNILIIEICNKLHQKLVNTMELIIKAINDKYEVEVVKKLSYYEKQIQNKNNELLHLAKEHNDFKEKLKKKQEETIKNIENNVKRSIEAVEQKIESIHLVKNYDPNYSFKNGMTYNIILSSTIFLMGGCAGYSNNFVGDFNKFSDFIFEVIITGLKWGLITFSFGLVLATIYAGITILEGTNQKQKLMQLIKNLRQEKENQINNCKKGTKESEELSIQRYNINVANIKKYLVELAAEKETHEKKCRDEVEKEIEEETKEILKLI